MMMAKKNVSAENKEAVENKTAKKKALLQLPQKEM